MRPVLNRIDDLRQVGLTSVMVVADYLHHRLAPLRERARPYWMYTGPKTSPGPKSARIGTWTRRRCRACSGW